MAFVRSDAATRRDIYLLSLEESREPVPVLTSLFFERAPALSPDGRLLAYESNESGEHEVYVAALPRMADRVKISRRGGITPLWSKDGRELFYVENDKMMVVEVTTEPTFTYSSPRVLFQGHYVPGVHTGAHWANYDVTADGKRFVMVRQAEAAGTIRRHPELARDVEKDRRRALTELRRRFRAQSESAKGGRGQRSFDAC